MGMKGTCRSANRGGAATFCTLSIYPASHFVLLPSCLPSWQIFKQSGQKGTKMNFYLVRFGVFSGKSETTIGKILIYF